MYLWRRQANRKWSTENEENLRKFAEDGLAVIEQPNRKQLQFEVASNQRRDLETLAKRFGGKIEKLPANWLKCALRRKTKPVKVGNKHLTIPAAAAFGTGEHATTALCLKMLERVMQFWGAYAPSRAIFGAPDLVIDLGTGSGILALAAKLLGVRSVVGIDNDPIAISTAKQNARLNGIRGAKFHVADLRRWKPPPKVDIITANLFSELLIDILPRIKGARWLIVSGILRIQERDVRRALTGNAIDIVEVRRRGKWVAMLAGRR